jgi:ATP-dependent DNA helicase DinG
MFRQGFGRLIRSSQDYGVCVVLDKRLAEKGYGKKFVRSLPAHNRTRDIGEVKKFLDLRNSVVE